MVFCRFPFCDVGHNADQAVSFPVRRASDNSAMAPEPESCAVWPNHPVIRRKISPVCLRGRGISASNGGRQDVVPTNTRLDRLLPARDHRED